MRSSKSIPSITNLSWESPNDGKTKSFDLVGNLTIDKACSIESIRGG
jgi:hypothetical protein